MVHVQHFWYRKKVGQLVKWSYPSLTREGTALLYRSWLRGFEMQRQRPKTMCVFFFGFSQKAFMGLKEGVGDEKINKNYLLLCWRRLCLEFSFSL